MRPARVSRFVIVSVTAGFLSLGVAAFASTATSGADPVGPDPMGPAQHGLCTAFVASVQAHPTNIDAAISFRNLRRAAVAAGYTADEPGVMAFCGAHGAPETTTSTTTFVADPGF